MSNFTAAELEAALEKAWQSGGRPEWIEVGGEVLTLCGEVQWLEEVCTPIGLARLFPALKSVGKT